MLKHQIPSVQAPEKHQEPISKALPGHAAVSRAVSLIKPDATGFSRCTMANAAPLEFEVWLFSGAWTLDAWSFPSS